MVTYTIELLNAGEASAKPDTECKVEKKTVCILAKATLSVRFGTIITKKEKKNVHLWPILLFFFVCFFYLKSGRLDVHTAV